jgi:hypothetical protein
VRVFKVAVEVKGCGRVVELRRETAVFFPLDEGSPPTCGIGMEAPGDVSLERIELLPTFLNERKALEALDLKDLGGCIRMCSSSCRLSLTTSTTTGFSVVLLPPMPLSLATASGASSNCSWRSNLSPV